MSAGLDSVAHEPQVDSDLGKLAPAFAAAVRDALAECTAEGIDAVVYEALRSETLQQVYYARGRTVIPPVQTVTNASSALLSWHGYGLAVDVIHRTLRWKAPADWWTQMAEVFKRHGCSWGGDWKDRQADLPHIQWDLCPGSPGMKARAALQTGGFAAVWSLYGADHT